MAYLIDDDKTEIIGIYRLMIHTLTLYKNNKSFGTISYAPKQVVSGLNYRTKNIEPFLMIIPRPISHPTDVSKSSLLPRLICKAMFDL